MPKTTALSWEPLAGATNIKRSPIIKGKLYLEISLDDIGPSSSGKTVLVASSHGNKNVEGYMLGVNVFRYSQPKAKAMVAETATAENPFA